MGPIRAGDRFYAMRTVVNEGCGVTPGDCGFVTHVGHAEVSFYLERRSGRGYMEAVCPLGLFAGNFSKDWRMAGLKVDDLADSGMGLPVNLTYAATRPFTRRFPEQYRW